MKERGAAQEIPDVRTAAVHSSSLVTAKLLTLSELSKKFVI